MASDLQKALTQLTNDFTNGVLEAIKGVSPETLVSARGGKVGRSAGRPAKSGRLERRSEDDIQVLATRITSLLKKAKNGLRSEQIQEKLSLDKREIPRPMALAIKSKWVKKTGQKRATTYHAR